MLGKELLEGRGGSVGITELKDKFLPLYMVRCHFISISVF